MGGTGGGDEVTSWSGERRGGREVRGVRASDQKVSRVASLTRTCAVPGVVRTTVVVVVVVESFAVILVGGGDGGGACGLGIARVVGLYAGAKIHISQLSRQQPRPI